MLGYPLGFSGLGFRVLFGDTIPPIMENQMEKTWKMKWKLVLYRGYIGDIVLFGGYYSTQYRVRLYPPFGV